MSGTEVIWNYVLDTDDFVTTGQIKLRADGTVVQRVYHSYDREYAPWGEAPRWGSGQTAESVEANTGPFYTLTRIG